MVKHKLISEVTHSSRSSDLHCSVLHDSLSLCYGATKLFSERHGRGCRILVSLVQRTNQISALHNDHHDAHKTARADISATFRNAVLGDVCYSKDWPTYLPTHPPTTYLSKLFLNIISICHCLCPNMLNFPPI